MPTIEAANNPGNTITGTHIGLPDMMLNYNPADRKRRVDNILGAFDQTMAGADARDGGARFQK